MAEEKEDDGKVTFKSTDTFSDSITSRHFSFGEYRLDEATANRLVKAGKGSIITDEKSKSKITANQKLANEKGESATTNNKSLKDDETLEMEQEAKEKEIADSDGDESLASGTDITNQVNSTTGLSGGHNKGSESTNEVNGGKATELPQGFPNRDELIKLGATTMEKIKDLGQKGLTDMKLPKAKVTKIGLALDKFEKENKTKSE